MYIVFISESRALKSWSRASREVQTLDVWLSGASEVARRGDGSDHRVVGVVRQRVLRVRETIPDELGPSVLTPLLRCFRGWSGSSSRFRGDEVGFDVSTFKVAPEELSMNSA